MSFWMILGVAVVLGVLVGLAVGLIVIVTLLGAAFRLARSPQDEEERLAKMAFLMSGREANEAAMKAANATSRWREKQLGEAPVDTRHIGEPDDGGLKTVIHGPDGSLIPGRSEAILRGFRRGEDPVDGD